MSSRGGGGGMVTVNPDGGTKVWDVLCVVVLSSVITRSRVVCAKSCSTIGETTNQAANTRRVKINPVRLMVCFLSESLCVGDAAVDSLR